MKVAIVVGTRPEIIKMASLIHLCTERGINFVLIHSNQHYSKDMDEIFFKELDLPAPHYNLNIGSGKHGNQTGNILINIEPIFEKEKPDIVFVQGDTNTTAAAALSASKLGIKVAHIEAGLRSYDKRMPEETNRIMTDHMSDYLFAVTTLQFNTLVSEGIAPEKIQIVGNTVADTLLKKLPQMKSNILNENNLKEKEYGLITIHRAGNVDTQSSLEQIINIFAELQTRFPYPLVWPIHPRTLNKINEFSIELPKNIIALPPLSYINFIHLQKNARLIFTDSGGIQEEACILEVPCITLRDNTERPETVDLGLNKLTGINQSKVFEAIEYFETQSLKWVNPFGNGTSAIEILNHCLNSKENNSELNFKKQNVSIVGLGYMGLPFACLLAEAGHKVNGFDIDEKKIKQIQSNICPFDEMGLPELLSRAIKSKNFAADTTIKPADVFIISVPTPVKDQKCDLNYVLSALESIAKVVTNGNLIILESTVRPNTCKEVIVPFFNNMNVKVNVAFCPERAIPGQTLFELVHNDRIIGGIDELSTELAKELYSTFIKGELFFTSATVAESVKLMENSFRDVNIALANEFSGICKELQINVWEAIKLANKHPRVNILDPGPGVGGHCIPIDSWFLTEKSQVAKLLIVAREINDNRPHVIAQQLIADLKKTGATKVGLLGVAYKKNVDDCRETPVHEIAEELLKYNFQVEYYDPFVKKWNSKESVSSAEELDQWADQLILTTDHDAFKFLRLNSPLLDTRGMIKQQTL
jgi:UDP-N-acetylglucosamine 2-epimerase (non-hydrolysing)